jgi:hypothetical protein
MPYPITERLYDKFFINNHELIKENRATIRSLLNNLENRVVLLSSLYKQADDHLGLNTIEKLPRNMAKELHHTFNLSARWVFDKSLDQVEAEQVNHFFTTLTPYLIDIAHTNEHTIPENENLTTDDFLIEMYETLNREFAICWFLVKKILQLQETVHVRKRRHEKKVVKTLDNALAVFSDKFDQLSWRHTTIPAEATSTLFKLLQVHIDSVSSLYGDAITPRHAKAIDQTFAKNVAFLAQTVQKNIPNPVTIQKYIDLLYKTIDSIGDEYQLTTTQCFDSSPEDVVALKIDANLHYSILYRTIVLMTKVLAENLNDSTLETKYHQVVEKANQQPE